MKWSTCIVDNMYCSCGYQWRQNTKSRKMKMRQEVRETPFHSSAQAYSKFYVFLLKCLRHSWSWCWKYTHPLGHWRLIQNAAKRMRELRIKLDCDRRNVFTASTNAGHELWTHVRKNFPSGELSISPQSHGNSCKWKGRMWYDRVTAGDMCAPLAPSQTRTPKISAKKKTNHQKLAFGSYFCSWIQHLKVVIPSTGCRDKKWFFRPPHDEFCISGHDIWGEGTWDRYLQAP